MFIRSQAENYNHSLTSSHRGTYHSWSLNRLEELHCAYTVEILIMHIVIMHNSHNALSFRGSRVGIRGKWVNIAYCIMHEVSGSIMHYEDTLYRG